MGRSSAGPAWNRKHARPANFPLESIEQSSGRPTKPAHSRNAIQYGHVVRLSDADYDYLRAMRQRIIEQIAAGPDRAVLLLPAMGKLIGAALREYASRHGVEPRLSA